MTIDLQFFSIVAESKGVQTESFEASKPSILDQEEEIREVEVGFIQKLFSAAHFCYSFELAVSVIIINKYFFYICKVVRVNKHPISTSFLANPSSLGRFYGGAYNIAIKEKREQERKYR